MPKKSSLPLQRIFEREKATSGVLNKVPSTFIPLTQIVFAKYLQ